MCFFRDLGSIDAKTTHPISKLKPHFQLRFSLSFGLKNKNWIRSILRVKFKGHLFPFQPFDRFDRIAFFAPSSRVLLFYLSCFICYDLSCIPFRDLINFARIQRYSGQLLSVGQLYCITIYIYILLQQGGRSYGELGARFERWRCTGIMGDMGELPGWGI